MMDSDGLRNGGGVWDPWMDGGVVETARQSGSLGRQLLPSMPASLRGDVHGGMLSSAGSGRRKAGSSQSRAQEAPAPTQHELAPLIQHSENRDDGHHSHNGIAGGMAGPQNPFSELAQGFMLHESPGRFMEQGQGFRPEQMSSLGQGPGVQHVQDEPDNSMFGRTVMSSLPPKKRSRLVRPKFDLAAIDDPQEQWVKTLAAVCSNDVDNRRKEVTDQFRKDAILNFRGFVDLERRGMLVDRIHVTDKLKRLLKRDLEKICKLFLIPKGGNKDVIVKRIMTFLEEMDQKAVGGSEHSSRGEGASTQLPGNQATSIGSFVNHHDASSARRSDHERPRSTQQLQPTPAGNFPNHHEASSARRPDHEGMVRTCAARSSSGQVRSMPVISYRTSGRTNAVEEASRIGIKRSSLRSDLGKQGHNVYVTGLGLHFDTKIAELDPMKPQSSFCVVSSPPLGQQKYLALLATQLDHSNAIPMLVFKTPPSVTVAGHDMQVHLRCLLMDPNLPPSEWQQMWPFPAYARVNNVAVNLDQARRYTNGKLAGVDMATNILAYLKKAVNSNPGSLNHVTLRRAGRNSNAAGKGAFLLFAQQVQVKRTEQVIKEVRAQTERILHERKQFLSLEDRALTDVGLEKKAVKSFMNDGGVETEAIKVSFRCPLSLTRIKIPARGEHCSHIQCFDLQNFIDYSRKSLKFECPVCNQKTADLPALIVSKFFEEAMRVFPDEEEVEVLADATLRRPKETKPAVRSSTGAASNEQQAQEDVAEFSAPQGQPRAKAEPVPEMGSEVIDLTNDDDEDENDPKEQNDQNYQNNVHDQNVADWSELDAILMGKQNSRDDMSTSWPPQEAPSRAPNSQGGSYQFDDDGAIVLSD